MRKRFIVMIGFVLMTVTLFSACSKNQKDAKTETTAASYHVHIGENGETYTHQDGEEQKEENTKKEDTNKEITNSEALEKVKAFSAKKLGLEGKKKEYTFLTATEMKEIDKKKYIEVIAAIKTEKDGDTVSIDNKGTYYVSADGSECFKRNMKTGEMEELK